VAELGPVRLASQDVADGPVAPRRRRRLTDGVTHDMARRPVAPRSWKRLTDGVTDDVAGRPVAPRSWKRLTDGVTDDVTGRPVSLRQCTAIAHLSSGAVGLVGVAAAGDGCASCAYAPVCDRRIAGLVSNVVFNWFHDVLIGLHSNSSPFRLVSHMGCGEAGRLISQCSPNRRLFPLFVWIG
jgi:hypothetical protein